MSPDERNSGLIRTLGTLFMWSVDERGEAVTTPFTLGQGILEKVIVVLSVDKIVFVLSINYRLEVSVLVEDDVIRIGR